MKRLAAAALAFVASTATGCFFLERTPHPGDRNHVEIPPQVFLASVPFDRLVVEVDCQEGCEPAPEALNDLVETLRAFCDKPGGVRLVRSDTVSATEVKGLTEEAGRSGAIAILALASRYRNVPLAAGEAHLYVLYLDEVRIGLWNSAVAFHAPMYPVLVIGKRNVRDAAWGWLTAVSVERAALIHELGHALGLVNEDSHEVDGHCTAPGCVMDSEVFSFRKFCARPLECLFGQLPRMFCDACRRELGQLRSTPVPCRIEFDGEGVRRWAPGGQYIVRIPLDPKEYGVEAAVPKDAAYWNAALRDPSLIARLYVLSEFVGVIDASPDLLAMFLGFLRNEPSALLRAEALGFASKALSKREGGAAAPLRDCLTSPSMVEVLLERLRSDRDPDVRKSACELAEAFAKIGPLPSPLSEGLRRALEADADDEVRRSAIRAIAHMGSSAAAALRTAAIRDSHSYVRVEAVAALGKIGGASEIPTLVDRLLHDPEARVRQEAAETLGGLGPNAAPALPFLEKARADPDADVRMEAGAAILQIQD